MHAESSACHYPSPAALRWPVAKKQQLDPLFVDKLASSGLTPEDAATLHMEFMTAEQTVAKHASFKSVPSLLINYLDPRTGKPLSYAPKWPPFIRVRYLKMATDIKSLAEKKPQKYDQLPDSGVCAYFPANIDWLTIINDPRTPLIITEGELKAAKACKEGYPCIGLGGTDNWQAKNKDGVLLIPDLEQINWVQRVVYIIFDSDFQTNPNICRATRNFALKLQALGAIPFFVCLPDVVTGGKTGLDDFLVHEKKPNALAALLHNNAEPLTMVRELWRMNDEIIFVNNPGLILKKSTGQKMAPANFKQALYANRTAPERVMRADGSVSTKEVPIADRWIEWPMRESVGSMSYRPGAEQMLINGSVDTSEWNLWPGWGCEPRRGDPLPFVKLLQHLFSGVDPNDMRWFTQWLAYPLQHPGAKLFTAAAMYGRHHGTGKSLVGFIMGQIYGRNFTQIKQADMEGTFTEYAENKQFIMVDDITGTDKRHVADAFKSAITQKEMRINIKYVPSFTVPDCTNYLLNSNQPDMIFVEDEDRRFFIHEVKVPPLADAFYADIDKRMKDGTLAPAVFRYLLDFDTSDFNPNAKARSTVAKELMIADVKSDLGSWVMKLRDDPDGTLRVAGIAVDGDLFTSAELLRLYDPTQRTTTTANGVARELHRAGVPSFRDRKPVRTIKGTERYYIVRNFMKWSKATPETAAAHLNARYKIGKGY